MSCWKHLRVFCWNQQLDQVRGAGSNQVSGAGSSTTSTPPSTPYPLALVHSRQNWFSAAGHGILTQSQSPVIEIKLQHFKCFEISCSVCGSPVFCQPLILQCLCLLYLGKVLCSSVFVFAYLGKVLCSSLPNISHHVLTTHVHWVAVR